MSTPLKSTSFTHDNKKYTLAIYNDESPSNPFEDWDSEPPLMYSTNHGCRWSSDTVYHYGTESIVSELLELITPRRLVLNRKELLDIIDVDEDYIRENKYDSQTFADALEDELLWNDDNLNLIEALARIARVPYSRHDSRGYSQGDYADVLIILTPEWFKKTWANPKDAKEILDGTKKLFNAWAWWDVYGFTLIEHKPLYTEDNVLSIVTDDEVLESCWGFYGEDSIEEDIPSNLPEFTRPHVKNLA